MLTQETPAHDLMKMHDPECVTADLKDITRKMVDSECALTFIILLVFM